MKCKYCGLPMSGETCGKCGTRRQSTRPEPLGIVPKWKRIDHQHLLVRFISNFPEFATGTPPDGEPLDHIELIQWLGNEIHSLVPEEIRKCLATHGTPYESDDLDDPNDFTVCDTCGGFIRRR